MFHVSEDDHEEIIPFFKLYSTLLWLFWKWMLAYMWKQTINGPI